MNRSKYFLKLFSALYTVTLFMQSSELNAQSINPKYYDIGSPTLTNIWVDPVNGNDNKKGLTKTSAVQTIRAALTIIPGTTTTTGYKICLVAGDYVYRDLATNNIVGLYLDERHGSFNYPIIIESVDSSLSAHIGLDFKTDPLSGEGGNTINFASGDYILIKNCRINGFDGITRKPQETLKVNQVKYIYVEDSDISGAFWFSLDYVGVQYGHIQGCKIHDASEDCLLLKGGTAQIRVEDNLIYNADRFGFSAGQGAGFDFFVVPWLHYEAYDLKFFNNIIYNTNYAGIAVLGGYNILIAYNTLYKVGIDKSGDRTLLSFNLGQRGCDGAENDTCDAHHQLGGWSPGPWSTPPLPYGTEVDCIPNKNIFVYNNIFYNPGADSTIGNQFEIRAPYDASDLSPTFLQSSNLPNPVFSDDNLQIKGNLIWNGTGGKLLISEENSGAQDSNPTCNRAQLLTDNIINTFEPQFVNHSLLNFHPQINSNIFTSTTYSVPDFLGNDKPARPIIPTGNLVNTVSRDYDGLVRSTTNPPGAYTSSTSTSVKNYLNDGLKNSFRLNQNYPNPFNPTTTIIYSLSKTAFVTLKIFDGLGREVTTLVSENKLPGMYEAKFDGTKLSSGVYFYKLTAGNFVDTKKLILIK